MLGKDKWSHLLRTLSFILSFSISLSQDISKSSKVFLKDSLKGFYTIGIPKEHSNKNDMHDRFHLYIGSDTVLKRSHKVSQIYSKKRKAFRRMNTHPNRLNTLLETLNSDIFIDIGSKRSPRPPPPPKEYIYGNDERTTIRPSMIKEYPYINVVRLSVGCTGTLLTPSYILTAAHCVHDGESFKENIEMLKVYVPNRAEFRTYYVRKITVPYLWLKIHTASNAHRAAYDYAVIKLNVAIHGRRSFMPLQVPTPRLIKEDLYFVGFDFRANSLLKSKCSERKTFFYKRNVLLSHCDSTAGNSGATVFYENRRSGVRKLLGVVSNTANAKSYGSRWTPMTFITLLTRRKVQDICDMIYPEGEQNNVCPFYARGNIDTASLSFFG